MAKVPHGVETLPKIWITWVGRTNVTDDRQTTDGRTTTYSERELDFTFANYVTVLAMDMEKARWEEGERQGGRDDRDSTTTPGNNFTNGFVNVC